MLEDGNHVDVTLFASNLKRGLPNYIRSRVVSVCTQKDLHHSRMAEHRSSKQWSLHSDATRVHLCRCLNQDSNRLRFLVENSLV